jgi:hypothetical protein
VEPPAPLSTDVVDPLFAVRQRFEAVVFEPVRPFLDDGVALLQAGFADLVDEDVAVPDEPRSSLEGGG